MAKLDRTKADPWKLKTPPGSADYTMHVDEKDRVKVLVCTVGKTVLHYDARCIDDLQLMLKTAGIGWNSAEPTSRNRRSKGPLKRGDDP